jgi:hypothetical protein
VTKPFSFSILIHAIAVALLIFGVPSLPRDERASAPVLVEFITASSGFLETAPLQPDDIESLIEQSTASIEAPEAEQKLSAEENLPPVPMPKIEEPETEPEEIIQPDLSELKIEPQKETGMSFDPEARIPTPDQKSGSKNSSKANDEPTTKAVTKTPEKVADDPTAVLTSENGSSNFVAQAIKPKLKDDAKPEAKEAGKQSKSTGEGNEANVNSTEEETVEEHIASPIPKPKPREIALLKKPKPAPAKKAPVKKPDATQNAEVRSEPTPEKDPELDNIINSVLATATQLEKSTETTTAPTVSSQEQTAGQVGGESLSQSEIQRLKRHLESNWLLPPGLPLNQIPVVTVRILSEPDGKVIDVLVMNDQEGSSFKLAAESARRAVLAASPLSLPFDKYDTWQSIKFTFKP